ncbi:CopG family transcriptional regulator [Candidatus Woesebacteria bacterium]|nr:CopG family transcriptional regulator [Candidatus Woesebacteria bacterium]
MQRISVHISDETKQRIDLVAKAKRKLESELIREAIDVGLSVIHPKVSSMKALVDLARMAEKLPSHPKDPTDVSNDTAKYAFGEHK